MLFFYSTLLHYTRTALPSPRHLSHSMDRRANRPERPADSAALAVHAQFQDTALQATLYLPGGDGNVSRGS